MATKFTIGFLGAGKMATALARGFIRAEIVSPKEIIASDLSEAARAAFTKETGAKTTASNADVLKFAERPDSGRETRPGRQRAGRTARPFHERPSADFHRRRGDARQNGSGAARRRARHSRDAQHARARGRGGGGVCARQIRDGGGRRTGEETSFRRRHRVSR